MVSSSSTEQLEDAPKNTKKRNVFFSFPRRKASKQHRAGPLNAGEKKTSQENPSRSSLTQEKSAAKELVDRAKSDSQDYTTAQRDSKRNLIALAYQTTTTKSFRESQNALTSFPAAASSASENIDFGNSGRFFSLSFTGSSFFRNICNDVFDSIDVDRSGKIDESELYQGLLLIHLKLGLYFGPAACKPISLDRTKYLFNKLDINRDGSLDKGEFQMVLVLLMGNVMSKILFQFVCTLLVVPFVANAIFENTLNGFGYIHGVVKESWLPVFQEQYQPLLEVALGWDLITRYASIAFATTTNAARNSGIADRLFDLVEVPVQYVVEKYDAFVLQPIGEIPQETWDSLPLAFVSTILTMIIVPLSIVKTDDSFRFLANRFGGKIGSS